MSVSVPREDNVTVGIASDTAKQYAYRGEYDPRNLDSLLRWINERRLAKITDSWKSIQTWGGCRLKRNMRLD